MHEFFNLLFSHFDPLSPFQCCNHVTVSMKQISTLKRPGERGLSQQQKRCFLNSRKDTDRKHLFCWNVSTLLSLIVVIYKSDGVSRFSQNDRKSFYCHGKCFVKETSMHLLAGTKRAILRRRYFSIFAYLNQEWKTSFTCMFFIFVHFTVIINAWVQSIPFHLSYSTRARD